VGCVAEPREQTLEPCWPFRVSLCRECTAEVEIVKSSRLLVVDTSTGRLLVQEADGSFEIHGDLRQGSDPPAGNELVVDGRGNAYVNGGGFDMDGRRAIGRNSKNN